MSHAQVALALAILAVPLAVLRYVLKDLLGPLGVPVWLGSLLASLWVLLGVGVLLMFGREGRAPGGRYRRAALPFVLLAAWCELLVIGGVLLTGARDADTYFCGPFAAVRDHFPTARDHAMGHVQGFLPRAVIWLVLGAVVYVIARRSRR